MPHRPNPPMSDRSAIGNERDGRLRAREDLVHRGLIIVALFDQPLAPAWAFRKTDQVVAIGELVTQVGEDRDQRIERHADFVRVGGRDVLPDLRRARGQSGRNDELRAQEAVSLRADRPPTACTALVVSRKVADSRADRVWSGS